MRGTVCADSPVSERWPAGDDLSPCCAHARAPSTRPSLRRSKLREDRLAEDTAFAWKLCGLEEIAASLGVNTSNVSRRLYKLGLEVAEQAGVEVRTEKNKVITAASIGPVKHPPVARAA